MFIEHSLCARYCSHARFLITQCTASHNETARLAEFQMRDTANPTSTTSNSIRIQEFILLVTLCLHSLSSIGQIHLFLLKKKPNQLLSLFICTSTHQVYIENLQCTSCCARGLGTSRGKFVGTENRSGIDKGQTKSEMVLNAESKQIRATCNMR